MLRLAFLLVALAPAAHAQTAAELPGAVVGAARLAEAIDGALGRQVAAGEFLTDPFDQKRAVDDSLRVRLRGVPAARLRRILAHLDGAEHRALHAHLLARRRAFATPGGRADARARLRDPARLADAGRTRRYHAATASEATVRATTAALYRRAFAAVPELRDVMAPDGGLDAVLAEHDAGSAAAYRREASILRVALAGLDASVVEAHIAFAASPDGRAFDALAQDAVAAALALDYAEALIERIWGPVPPPAPGPGTVDVADQQPELIGGLEALWARAQDRYPRLAREVGIEGRVTVQFVVDEHGYVVDPMVTWSPSDLLSRAALETVQESRFYPGNQDGQPVRVRFSLPVDFVLPP